MKITNTLARIMLISVPLVLSQQVAAQTPCPIECQPLGYIGPMELSTTDLTNGAKGYRGWFENGAWQGDLIEYDVSSGGTISTSIDLSGASPQQSGGGGNWSAHVTFADTADTTSHWNTGRKIIFSNNYGGNQRAFRWQNLDIYQKPALDNITPLASLGEQSAVLNYLRGARDNEGPTGGMRTRFTVLGDIIHSNPVYVGAPDGDFTDSDYVTFKNDNANRTPHVYVGANDGMLHAFNAANGQEEWAYVPSMLIPKMRRIAGRPYEHTYFVDGGITVRDAQVGGSWSTVLVGSLGAGGRGLFALDVTDPSLTSESAIGGSNRKIMWEERGENTPGDPAPGANPDIGYIFDASSIAQLNDGKWYAVFGNGVGSDNGQAMLMMKELESGPTSPAVIEIPTAGSTGNGLSAPALVDSDGDGRIDIAWAGDIQGDLWRFDLPGGPGTWATAYKVYDGDPSQPITRAPDVTRHPQFGYLVLFGTGKLYEEADLTTTSTQALYGIWDTGVAPTAALPLMSQELSFNTSYTRFGFNEMVRTFTTTVEVDYSIYKGWKVELYPGERMLTPPQLRAGRLKTTIYNPIDGTNWLLEANFRDGNMAENSIYNLNQDTSLNELDRVNGNGNSNADGSPDYSDPEDIPMGWKRPDGNMSQPTIASLSAGVDTIFLNFLNPPVVQTAIVPAGCTGNCVGGIEGGHIDLDHDTELMGSTDEHDHEYDDDVNRTYVDYLDMVQQHDITDDLNGNDTFIPLISNADLNKGATLKIVANGQTVEYNVVEYQKMIHQALLAWDGPPTTLTDPEGNSLIFRLRDIDEMKMIFNSLAIISGGVHPTQTGCVKDNEPWRSINGRWRNGALTLHLVEKNLFNGLGSTENALDRLLVQIPTDFQEAVYLTDGTGIAMTDPGSDGIVDGTAPAYEIYGGLRADPARSNTGFLYESTTFWHFNDDSSKCYGQPGWAQDYYNASQQTVTSIFFEAFERTGATTLEDLVAIIDGLLDSGCATEGGGTSGDKDTKDATETTTTDPTSCQAQYDEYVDLLALGRLIEANGTTINCGSNCLGDGSNGGGGNGSGTSISGDPLVMIGGVNATNTSGPNFEVGRRTWIDILPE